AICEIRGRLDEALRYREASAQVIESLSRDVPEPGRLGGSNMDPMLAYRPYASLLVKAGRNGDALIALEKGRGRGLAIQLSRSRDDLLKTLSPQEAADL